MTAHVNDWLTEDEQLRSLAITLTSEPVLNFIKIIAHEKEKKDTHRSRIMDNGSSCFGCDSGNHAQTHNLHSVK